MVSPSSSSSRMKLLVSLSQDDSGVSKGETANSSLGKGRSSRESVTEFLARVIGMEKCLFLILRSLPL